LLSTFPMFVCVSRACLGKSFAFSTTFASEKGAKKGRLSPTRGVLNPKRGEKGAFFTNLAPGFFIRERNVNALHKPAETPPFTELSLHLSRACLGKTIALHKTPSDNQPKKGVLFSRTVCEQLRLDHRGGLSHQLRARGLCLLCPRRPTALETQS
jgi:hypothetical protein